MNQKKTLTIKEFARLTGIKPENLRFYDRIGLLCPEMRGKNNYRYYSSHQLNLAYLIVNLRGLDVGIDDIKRYAACPTPENTLALLSQQQIRIEEERRQLEEMEVIMRMYSDMIKEALRHGEEALFLEEKAQEPIFLCPPIPKDMDEEEGGLFSYDYAEANGINLGFPCGTLYSQSILESGDTVPEERVFFKLENGGNSRKPAGLYAVAYGMCETWDARPVYRRLIGFIQEQGLHIRGDLYEEYPFGYTVAQEANPCCIRVEIPVAPREAEAT